MRIWIEPAFSYCVFSGDDDAALSLADAGQVEYVLVRDGLGSERATRRKLRVRAVDGRERESLCSRVIATVEFAACAWQPDIHMNCIAIMALFLESLPRPIHRDEPVTHPVQYTSDGEHTYAHVAVSSGVDNGARLIFQWDGLGEWRYHDANIMPFPPDSRPTLQIDASSSPLGYVQKAVPSTYPEPQSYGHLDGEHAYEDDDDDDYWNSYGSHEDVIPDGNSQSLSGRDTGGGTEDAYWAQYSSVHGTADSTQPSPLPQPHRKSQAVYTDSSMKGQSPRPLPVHIRSAFGSRDDALPIPLSAIPRPNLHSKWDPASPGVLADLLSKISPRPTGSFSSEIASPTVGGSNGSNDSDTPGPVSGLQEAGSLRVQRPSALKLDDTSAGQLASTEAGVEGLWKLWKAGRRRRGGIASSREEDGEVTAARNADLEARVEELEREVSVWKAAFKNSDEEKKALSKNVLKLERNIGALREDNPLILCLIDGDGNIFSQDLITLGQVGGRQAAMLLTKGLTDHLASIDPSDAATPGRGQVWLTIYCNKSGLLETLLGNNVCTTEQFDAFVIGFNQASPLFAIVDVGSGKEAADSKIKECLRVFTRFPQTSRVFFGGGHDNGYTSTLNYLQNEGLLDKVILLRGYKDLAHELKSLELPHLEIEGVFMTKKMHSNPFKKNKDASQAIPIVQPQDFEKFRSKPAVPAMNQSAPSPVRRPRRLDPDQLDFEEECRQQREKNLAQLKAMGLGGALLPPKKKSGKPRAPKKRKAAVIEAESETGDAEPPLKKVPRTEGTDGGDENPGLRRSGRNRGRTVDYKDEANISNGRLPRLASVQAGIKTMDTEPRSINKRIHDPKTFGAIPGISVGTWWQTRIVPFSSPFVAGISGGPQGAYSVALSGGYEDDIDLGNAFTYTGAGGRDLKGTKAQPKN
ncbi:hypothetical protein B0H21DRAFT_778993 [Amylocystis lapponica]|nr:hypothetical protein B0H21DRAFT_778993 [Amylocystis lapponica]